jgi:hypothetical protein
MLGSAVGPRGAGASWLVMAVFLLLAPFTMAFSSTWGFSYWLGALAVAATVWLLAAGFIVARARRPDREPGEGRGRIAPRLAALAAVLVVAVLAGQKVQANYFENRYASPDFTTAGLSEAFAWARDVDGASIATNATRQYPLAGKMLGNRVEFIGEPRPSGGYVKPETCRAFKQAINRGDHDYAVITLDRPSPKRPFARELDWVEGDPALEPVLKEPPTAVFELTGPLDPDLCP